MTVKRFLIGIRWAIALVVVNYLIASAMPVLLSKEISDASFLTGRVIVTLFAGWLVVWNSVGGLWHAALAGVLLNFMDHVLFKGGYYLVVHFFAPNLLPFSALQSFWGVLISFGMFIWVPAVVGILGALAARLYLKRRRPPVQSGPAASGRPLS